MTALDPKPTGDARGDSPSLPTAPTANRGRSDRETWPCGVLERFLLHLLCLTSLAIIMTQKEQRADRRLIKAPEGQLSRDTRSIILEHERRDFVGSWRNYHCFALVMFELLNAQCMPLEVLEAERFLMLRLEALERRGIIPTTEHYEIEQHFDLNWRRVRVYLARTRLPSPDAGKHEEEALADREAQASGGETPKLVGRQWRWKKSTRGDLPLQKTVFCLATLLSRLLMLRSAVRGLRLIDTPRRGGRDLNCLHGRDCAARKVRASASEVKDGGGYDHPLTHRPVFQRDKRMIERLAPGFGDTAPRKCRPEAAAPETWSQPLPFSN